MDEKKAAPAIPQPVVAKPPPAPPAPAPRFAKPPPADLYRRLLPAALFLLTFVTVMTMLLVYMDTTALRAQQFRVNMTRDYDLRRIGQNDTVLVDYVRQLQMSVGKRPLPALGSDPLPARVQTLVDAVDFNDTAGTFVEVLVRGARDPGALYLEAARGWRGLVVRADPRDALTVRAGASARTLTLHACLSPEPHPKEVTYYDSWHHDGVTMAALGESGFSSRVLCLPLYTLLLASNTTDCRYMLLSSPNTLRALHTLPFQAVNIQLIEVRMAADVVRNATTEYLRRQGYEVRAQHDEGVLYERASDIASDV